MSPSWRFKIYLTLAAILLALYALVPTLFDFGTSWEEAEKKGESPAWYVKIFPKKEINLGLDLRGGIYLELEVTVEDAITNRLDLIAGDLSRYLKGEKLEGARLEHVPKTRWIRASGLSPEALKKLSEHVEKDYAQTLVLQETGLERVYQADEKEEGRLQALYEQIVALFSGDSNIVDISRASGSGQFRILFSEKSSVQDRNAAHQLLASKLPGLKEVPELNRLLFKVLDSYIDNLRSETVKQAVEKIRNRIDRYGVAEPSIRQLGTSRIMVELPGVQDPERAIGIVKKSGRLEFKLLDETKTREDVVALVGKIRQENKIPEGFTEEIIAKINELAKTRIPSDSEILFEIERDPITKKIARALPYLVKRKAEITGDMLQNAQVNTSDKGPHVALAFNPTGTQIFAEISKANVGKQFAIILDGTVMSAPVIREPILDGHCSITHEMGDYNEQLRQAQDLVFVLREGALPATLKEITKTVIGPSLGKEAVHQGLVAVGLAALTVVIFMMIYYKFSGLIANVALLLNVLLIVGCLALFQATLTLPGIAGIVLTMGMALDGSVIIFERIREELKGGKPARGAVESGFANAWTAFLDTHLTTFLSGLVLYQFGTGPIRGFAVTLMIGVLTTLFTAYLVSKLLFEYLVVKVKIQKVSI